MVNYSAYSHFEITITPLLFVGIVDFVSIRLTHEFPMFSARFKEDKWERDKEGNYREKPSTFPQETYDKVMFFLCRMLLSCIDSSRDELDASSYPMVQDKTTGANCPHSFHDTTFVELVQPLLAILACKQCLPIICLQDLSLQKVQPIWFSLHRPKLSCTKNSFKPSFLVLLRHLSITLFVNKLPYITLTE